MNDALGSSAQNGWLAINPEFELHRVEGSSKHYLCVNGRRYYVGPDLAATLTAIRRLCRIRRTNVLRATELQQYTSGCTMDRLIAALTRLGILPEHAEGAPSRQNRPESYIKLKISLIRARAIAFLARPFTLFFAKPVVRLFVTLIFLAHAYYFATEGTFYLGGERIVTAFHEFVPADFLFVYLIFIASISFHEMGHAAAAVHHGIIPRRIGFGIYFVFPVMFADVTESWRLQTAKRMTINAAGIYFQALLNSILIAILIVAAPQSSFLSYVILLNVISVIHSLNPILRFDGYWLASDALGVPNLRAQAWRQLAEVVQTPAKALSGIHRKLLTAYSLVTFGFMSLYLYWFYDLIAHVVMQTIHNPGALSQAFILSGPTDILLMMIRLIYICIYGVVAYVVVRSLARYFAFGLQYGLRRIRS